MNFVGDFYSFHEDEDDENEGGGNEEGGKGYGMVKRLGSEGNDYVICAKECKCFVECNGDNGDEENSCGEGMECVEYKCVNNDVLRRGESKEGQEEGERRIGSVVIMVPMVLCTLGVFTSMYLAKEYGDRYFSEECKDKCKLPYDAREYGVETEVELEEGQHNYACSGRCFLNEKSWTNIWEEMLKKEEKDYVLMGKKDINVAGTKQLCWDSEVVEDMIATDITSAAEMFIKVYLRVECKFVNHDFKFVHRNLKDNYFLDGDSFCEAARNSVTCYGNGEIYDNGKIIRLTDPIDPDMDEFDK